jgi:hypothetical protein
MSLATSQQAHEIPDAVVLADGHRPISWAALDDTLNREANALLSVDLRPARRVAVSARKSWHDMTVDDRGAGERG